MIFFKSTALANYEKVFFDFKIQSINGEMINFDKYRNKIHKYQDIDLIVTYHPKNLLSSPEFKRPTWEDFKYIRDKYLDGKQ